MLVAYPAWQLYHIAIIIITKYVFVLYIFSLLLHAGNERFYSLLLSNLFSYVNKRIYHSKKKWAEIRARHKPVAYEISIDFAICKKNRDEAVK